MKFLAHFPHVLRSSETGTVPLRRRQTRLLHRAALVFCLGVGSAAATCPTQASQEPAAAPAPAPASTPTQAAAPEAPEHPQPGEITEEQVKQLLVGKQLFLRGGYQGDSLTFNEHGDPAGHPVAGSYTLSAVEIRTVHLSKHKLELTGDRYALHFLGALPYEDPSKAVDRVKITPKKKVLRITIDREQVIKEKKAKEAPKAKSSKPGAPPPGPTTAPVAVPAVASSETGVSSAPAPAPAPPPAPAPAPAAAPAETAAEQAADRPADAASVTTTTSPAHAAKVLRDAIDKVFASGLDDKVRAQMPQFWQLYYQAQAAGVDYRPKDSTVVRSNQVDTQAKVVSSIAPDSNEFAQASGIAGRALYRAVIGPDGRPGEIAVVRPIGFGLDENAVAAIRKATFEPATKGGQPVAESLDLAVLFRIYSKRTSVAASESKSSDPVKPGPYTIRAQQDAEKQPEPEKQPQKPE